MLKISLIVWLCVIAVIAQEQTPLALVERAVKEAGGDVWARPKTLQLRGQATVYWQGNQAEEIKLSTYKMWRLFPTESAAARQANGEVRFDAFADSR